MFQYCEEMFKTIHFNFILKPDTVYCIYTLTESIYRLHELQKKQIINKNHAHILTLHHLT